jgi:excisionase family DNA binding protein
VRNAAIENQDVMEVRRVDRKPPLSEPHPRIQDAGMPLLTETVSYSTNGLTPAPTTLRFPSQVPNQERLLNAREVAARLGVSERWVRDHTSRRAPTIRAVKLGTLVRYRRADVETFMENLDTFHAFHQPRLGV